MHSDKEAIFDCYAILDVLFAPINVSAKPGQRASRWDFLWADLKARAAQVPSRKNILRAALQSQLPTELRPADWPHLLVEPASASEKTPADIIIVCVLEVEYNATLAAFGIDQTKAEEINLFGHPFVRKVLETRHCGLVGVWITLIGRPRNLVCANFCRDVFDRFSVRHCCILVGIAAGHPEQVTYGDVVGAKLVLDYEGARVERRGVVKPRPVPYPLKPPFSETFEAFAPERWDWLSGRDEALPILEQTRARLPKGWEARAPEFRTGIVVSGEKLRRDNPLPKLSDLYGDGVLALEMEGCGFASACESKGVPWLVFRGITDHATAKKKDGWHSIASLNAGTAARCFIANWLRPAGKDDEIP